VKFWVMFVDRSLFAMESKSLEAGRSAQEVESPVSNTEDLGA
jgi:hypothetical protein